MGSERARFIRNGKSICKVGEEWPPVLRDSSCPFEELDLIVRLLNQEAERLDKLDATPLTSSTPTKDAQWLPSKQGNEVVDSDSRLRRQLEKAATRIQILLDRMKDCDAGNAHPVSMIEGPEWIEEIRDVLAPQTSPDSDAEERSQLREALVKCKDWLIRYGVHHSSFNCESPIGCKCGLNKAKEYACEFLARSSSGPGGK